MTQQDQGPSGHRRVYLTTKVVAKHGATLGCSGCVGLGPHTDACRVRLEKALADGRADPVETPMPASSSSGLVAPMPTQTFRTSRWIHRWSWDQKKAENAKDCGQARRREVKSIPEGETCTFEVDCRPVKSGDKFIAFVSVCDGVDDAYNSPLTFGPRTWENGVGSENIADVHYCKEANPETGENPFVWHRLRFVSRPGGTICRRLDGSVWVQVRNGRKSFHMQSEGMKVAMGVDARNFS